MVGTTFCYSRAITLRPNSDSESPFSKMESANRAALGRLKRDLNYLFSRVATGQKLGSQEGASTVMDVESRQTQHNKYLDSRKAPSHICAHG